jgi:Ca2+:H+ antiporter
MVAARTPRWTWTWPVSAWVILLVTPFFGYGGLIDAAAGVALLATVFAAVHHAEVIAHRVGEPFGTLILALAVTMIETALIVSVMIAAPEAHAPPPGGKTTVLSAGLLVVSLIAIVGLAKILTPTVERGIAYLDVPKAVVGIVIATLVLLPESVAALRAARSNRLQTSLNLTLGSALATIGLTIPAVAAVSIGLGQRLELGLNGKDQALLAVTLILGVITLGTGRTTVLQGIVHLVIFAAFLFFAVVP